MRMHQIIDDRNNRVVRIEEYDFTTISRASERLNEGDHKLSQHEYSSAAIVNGRMDLIGDEDLRKTFVKMGRSWAHATIETIFDHWEREMALPGDHPRCPVGEQRIFTRD